MIQVVGGGPVPDGKYPFVASILFEGGTAANDHERLHCTGTLIDPQWVLTAAHCMDDGEVAVTVGRTVLSSDQGERFNVAEVFVHPLWDWSGPHDVALLRLDGSSRVTPIPVAGPKDEHLEQAGTVMTMAGWGLTDPADFSSVPDRMQSADVPALDDRQCAGDAGADFICAGTPGVTGCFGDSGGPLFTSQRDGSLVQLGVAHGGPACGGPYTMYIDLNDFDVLRFIDATLKGKKSPFRIPEDPCPDGLYESQDLRNYGRPVQTDDGYLRRATFSGVVCRKSLDDRFTTMVRPGPIDGADAFVGAELTFDPAPGNLDLRFKTCIDAILEVCTNTVPNVVENAAGNRSLRWTNTTGEWLYAVVDVVLTQGAGPVPYTLVMYQNIPAPPPPPSCGGLPSDDGAPFESPGEHHFTGTLCSAVSWDVYETRLPHDATLSADLQTIGAGVVGMYIAWCDEAWNCEWTDTIFTSSAGVASVSWTNCETGPRSTLVVVEHYEGQETVNFDLDVLAEVEVTAC